MFSNINNFQNNNIQKYKKVPFSLQEYNQAIYNASYSNNPVVRQWVAQMHKNSYNVGYSPPQEILRRLAKDPEFTVRRAIASNPETPPDVLYELAYAQEWYIFNTLIFNNYIDALQQIIALNPNASLQTLEYLQYSENIITRCNVASNPHSSLNILEYLSQTNNSFLLKKILLHPKVNRKLKRKIKKALK